MPITDAIEPEDDVPPGLGRKLAETVETCGCGTDTLAVTVSGWEVLDTGFISDGIAQAISSAGNPSDPRLRCDSSQFDRSWATV